MAKLKPAIIVAIVFAVFIAIGAVYVYSNTNGSHTADAHYNSDGTISYTLTGPSSNYSYSVFSDTDIPNKVYLYYDDSYRSDFNNAYTQKEYFDVLKSMLERRGVSVSYANANELKDVMSDGDNAVVFVSGALPDTVYDGTVNCRFAEWMNKGGSVYWSGPEIGRYISSQNSMKDLGKGFFDGEVNDGKNTEYAYNESDMFAYTQMRYDDCTYGLKADRSDTKVLAYISDDGYSSVSVARLFKGNATIIGGNMTSTEIIVQAVTDRTCVADLISCGLTYESEGLEHGTGEVKDKVSANTSKNVSSYSDVTIWLSCGEPASDWGRSIELK